MGMEVCRVFREKIKPVLFHTVKQNRLLAFDADSKISGYAGEKTGCLFFLFRLDGAGFPGFRKGAACHGGFD
jgi:hypothetical protein